MSEYNGWSSWNVWNVGLWLGNEESLYRLVQEHSRHHAGRHYAGMEMDIENAAKAIVSDLADLGVTKTPDGAEYDVPSVIEYLESDWADTYADEYADSAA